MLRSVAVACVIAALLVAGPRLARANDQLVAPLVPSAPVTTHHEPYVALAVAGGITFGLIYGLTLFGAALTVNGVDGECDCKGESLMYVIPVVGPWMADTDPRDRWLVAAWSGIQAAGLTMLIVGLIGHEVPDAPLPALPTKVTIVPTVTSELEGLSLRMSW